MISPITSELTGNIHYLKILDRKGRLLIKQLVGSNWIVDMTVFKIPIKYSHCENGEEIWKEMDVK